MICSDYPLATEKLKVSVDMLSPTTHQWIRNTKSNIFNEATVIPNLNDKAHYVLHFSRHAIDKNTQSAWIWSEPLAENLHWFQHRKAQIGNNSVFSKTMENVHKRVNVKLVNNPKQLKKLTASPLFDYIFQFFMKI
jgi:hypothetical protein